MLTTSSTCRRKIFKFQSFEQSSTLFLALPEFPQDTVWCRSKEDPMPITSSIRTLVSRELLLDTEGHRRTRTQDYGIYRAIIASRGKKLTRIEHRTVPLL